MVSTDMLVLYLLGNSHIRNLNPYSPIKIHFAVGTINPKMCVATSFKPTLGFYHPLDPLREPRSASELELPNCTESKALALTEAAVSSFVQS